MKERSGEARTETIRNRKVELLIVPTARAIELLQQKQTGTVPARATYCAFIHLSEPATLTDTLEMKTCRGLASAVPRCSVETNRGPAFL
jgi:hypothetical protein